MLLRTLLLALAATPACLALPAQAAESYENCTGFIDSLPASISTQGTWCLRKHLSLTLGSGAAITIAANNVVLDCNGFGLSNQATSGLNTGVGSSGTVNVSVRRCHVAGFRTGIRLTTDTVGNFRVEDSTVHAGQALGIYLIGDGSLVRGNTITAIAGQGYAGIWTSKTADVLDNTVDGVIGPGNVFGIYSIQNDGGRIARNRIRHLTPPEGYEAVGIAAVTSLGMGIRDNDIASSASGITKGVACVEAKARVRGNIIKGFATGIDTCADVAGNDVSTL